MYKKVDTNTRLQNLMDYPMSSREYRRHVQVKVNSRQAFLKQISKLSNTTNP